MLGSITGVENCVNIMNICYTCVCLLPWRNKKLKELQGESAQHIKYILSQEINRELFFASFVMNAEKAKKYLEIIKPVISKILLKRCL